MDIQEHFKLRKTNPNEFWKGLVEQINKEYWEIGIDEQYREITQNCVFRFIEKQRQREKFPYHIGYFLDPIPNYLFRFFVNYFATCDAEIIFPKPVITGVIPFPNETYYTIHIHADSVKLDLKEEEFDIFTPHFIDQYARRSFKLPTDIQMPQTWHHKRIKDFEDDKNAKDLKNLFYFIGKFFARNKLNRLYKCDGALSEEERKENVENKYVCLWMDGISYCEQYVNQKVWIQKTFLSYEQLKPDQWRAIIPDFAILCEIAHQQYPSQYEDLKRFFTMISKLL